ncbi:hypothetical protein AAFF_G00341610 [Aldrovandia affinis]|uniref:Uncharacterized protein n=1 Tax=Aldrovandia affinis TaxID=143900 RepID=A0AAD7SLD3_9TELE|nr:hypothetical protein AAFF_G00341610 [Aldrovandia affinis]
MFVRVWWRKAYVFGGVFRDDGSSPAPPQRTRPFSCVKSSPRDSAPWSPACPGSYRDRVAGFILKKQTFRLSRRRRARISAPHRRDSEQFRS